MKLLCALLTATALLVSTALYSQAQATNWHFGQMRTVTFAGGEPLAGGPSAMLGFEGVVSMSDSLGRLLFYTNGGGFPGGDDGSGRTLTTGVIWNRNHEVMYDMQGLEGGGWSARQSSIAMPDPGGAPGIYYLFTMEESGFDAGGAIEGQPRGRGLSYFVIDMNRNGGLGAVTVADRRVYVPAYEGLDATPMTDGTGYWIACHTDSGEGGSFVLVPLTADGVGEPVPYPAPRPVRGRVKFSPDGTLLYNNGLVYTFDAAGGLIGGVIAEVGSVIKNTVTFTPDSRYLYALEDDLNLGLLVARYGTAEDYVREPIERLAASGVPATDALANGPIQIGPNGKLYYLEFRNGNFGLSEIDCASAAAPSVTRFVLTFPGVAVATQGRYNLPAYVDAIFARPYAPDTLVLDTLPVAGCAGQDRELMPVTDGSAYRWSSGDTTRSLGVTETGLYCVTITGGCQPTVACFAAELEDFGLTVEPRDSVVDCGGTTLTLEAIVTGSFDSLRWSGGETTPTISRLLTEPGVDFAVTVFGRCGERNAGYSVDYVAPVYAPELVVSPAEGEVCAGDEVTFSVRDNGDRTTANALWFDGTARPAITVEALRGVDYTVAATSECGQTVSLMADLTFTEQCNCELVFPELVTPNGDGTNDNFGAFTNCTVEDFTLIVYNRWGRKVFEGDGNAEGWDGTTAGTPQEQGGYLYQCAFRYAGTEDVETREGQFTLVR